MGEHDSPQDVVSRAEARRDVCSAPAALRPHRPASLAGHFARHVANGGDAEPVAHGGGDAASPVGSSAIAPDTAMKEHTLVAGVSGGEPERPEAHAGSRSVPRLARAPIGSKGICICQACGGGLVDGGRQADVAMQIRCVQELREPGPHYERSGELQAPFTESRLTDQAHNSRPLPDMPTEMVTDLRRHAGGPLGIFIGDSMLVCNWFNGLWNTACVQYLELMKIVRGICHTLFFWVCAFVPSTIPVS